MASARFTSKAPETYLGGYDGQVWLQPISWTSAPMSALVVRFVHPASNPSLPNCILSSFVTLLKTQLRQRLFLLRFFWVSSCLRIFFQLLDARFSQKKLGPKLPIMSCKPDFYVHFSFFSSSSTFSHEQPSPCHFCDYSASYLVLSFAATTLCGLVGVYGWINDAPLIQDRLFGETQSGSARFMSIVMLAYQVWNFWWVQTHVITFACAMHTTHSA